MDNKKVIDLREHELKYKIQLCDISIKKKKDEKKALEIELQKLNQKKYIITHEQLKTLTDYNNSDCFWHKQKAVITMREVIDCEVETYTFKEKK